MSASNGEHRSAPSSGSVRIQTHHNNMYRSVLICKCEIIIKNSKSCFCFTKGKATAILGGGGMGGGVLGSLVTGIG